MPKDGAKQNKTQPEELRCSADGAGDRIRTCTPKN